MLWDENDRNLRRALGRVLCDTCSAHVTAQASGAPDHARDSIRRANNAAVDAVCGWITFVAAAANPTE